MEAPPAIVLATYLRRSPSSPAPRIVLATANFDLSKFSLSRFPARNRGSSALRDNEQTTVGECLSLEHDISVEETCRALGKRLELMMALVEKIREIIVDAPAVENGLCLASATRLRCYISMLHRYLLQSWAQASDKWDACIDTALDLYDWGLDEDLSEKLEYEVHSEEGSKAI